MMIYVLIFLGGSLLYSQCDEYNNEFQCGANNSCQWVEDIESVTCASLVWDEELCEAAPECTYWCDDGGGYFGWCDPYCGGGMTYIDNGSCQEVEMPECSEMIESQCESDETCDWVEDIQWGNCDNYNSSASCNNAHEDCITPL